MQTESATASTTASELAEHWQPGDERRGYCSQFVTDAASGDIIAEVRAPWLADGRPDADGLRKRVAVVAASPALLQTVKDLVGLAAMRPGHLGDYKAALDDARALIERAEGRA